MLKILISSSILICVLVLLRMLIGNRVDPRLRYALWLLAALRLLIPFSISASPVSVMNTLPQQAYIQETPLPVAYMSGYEQNTAVDGHETSEAVAPNKISVAYVLRWVWLAGAAVAAIWFTIRNTLFYVNLKRTRRPVPDLGRDVYISDYVSSPCLFGLFRPAIYLTPETAADNCRTECILAHERTHIAHGDHIWALLRTVCLVIYWFDPLVWLAASLSRRDGELACDVGAVKRLGMERRTEYGDMILDVLSMGVNSARPNIAVAMASKRGVRERVSMLSGIRKKSLLATAALLAAVLLTACATFTEGNPESSPTPSEMPEYVGTTSTDRLVYDLLDAQMKRIIAGESEPGGPPHTAEIVFGTVDYAFQGGAYWRVDGKKVWHIGLNIGGVKPFHIPCAGDTAKILELLNPKGWTPLDHEPKADELMADPDGRRCTLLTFYVGDLVLGLYPGSGVGYYEAGDGTVWLSVDSEAGSGIMSLFKTDATISTLLGTGSEISVRKDGSSIVLDSETRAEAEKLLMAMDIESCAALPYADGGEAFFSTGRKNHVNLCGSYGKVVWFSISGPSGSGLFVGPYFDEYEALMKIWQDTE